MIYLKGVFSSIFFFFIFVSFYDAHEGRASSTFTIDDFPSSSPKKAHGRLLKGASRSLKEESTPKINDAEGISKKKNSKSLGASSSSLNLTISAIESSQDLIMVKCPTLYPLKIKHKVLVSLLDKKKVFFGTRKANLKETLEDETLNQIRSDKKIYLIFDKENLEPQPIRRKGTRFMGQYYFYKNDKLVDKNKGVIIEFKPFA